MRLYSLLKDVKILKTNISDFSAGVSGITDSSKKVSTGCVFVCVPGIKHDGHDYIGRAVLSGASVIVCERMTDEIVQTGIPYVLTDSSRRALALMWSAWYGNPQKSMKTFAVTGTNGLKAKLFIVGPADDDCGIDKELTLWAKTSENVVFAGMADVNQMCRYYCAMDVLVHPTYREGFGMVIQEAGALGVPVITTKIPGASEVMEDGISSVHIAPKSTEELAEAMREVRENPEKVKELGIRAYQRTKELYDRTVMLENQRKDYENLIGN